MKSPTPAILARNIFLEGRIHAEDFRVQKGECVVLCGPNGSGKSSLLRLLCGLEADFKGQVHIDGGDLRALSRRARAGHIAWLPQRPSFSEALTCGNLVAAARYRFLEALPQALTKASSILSEHGASHLQDRLSSQVSGGELQRVLLAAMTAQEAPILLVDEPANHLDPLHQVATYKRLGQMWRQEERTLIIVSHDLRLAKLLGPANKIRIVGILSGQITEDTLLSDPTLPAALKRLYGISFVDGAQPGAFSVDLSHELASPGKEE